MKITKIKTQKRAGRYNIYLDGKFFLGIGQETLIKAGLKKGQEISPSRLKKLKEKEAENKAWQRALKFLGYRVRSEQEMRDYLLRKEVDQKTIDQTIKLLIKQGQLNDQEFARVWIKDRQAKLKGPRLIYSELVKKGIGKEIIETGLKKWYNSKQERKIAQKAFEKKAGQEKEKIFQYLMRRGFDYDIIKEVLDKNNKQLSK